MADPEFAKNPWSAEYWNLTRQGAYLKKYGLTLAEAKAEAAGTTLNGPRPGDVKKPPFTVVVQRRNIIAPFPQGFAGDGPPDPEF